MTVTHVVLFKFKPTLTRPVLDGVCRRFLELQSQCLHPESDSPYILGITGGRNNSPEDASDGLTHGFVVEFANAEDRNWYVEKDPAHVGFKKSLESVVEKVTVFDFTNGDF